MLEIKPLTPCLQQDGIIIMHIILSVVAQLCACTACIQTNNSSVIISIPWKFGMVKMFAYRYFPMQINNFSFCVVIAIQWSTWIKSHDQTFPPLALIVTMTCSIYKISIEVVIINQTISVSPTTMEICQKHRWVWS